MISPPWVVLRARQTDRSTWFLLVLDEVNAAVGHHDVDTTRRMKASRGQYHRQLVQGPGLTHHNSESG